jgi:hypothetical protein
MDDDRRRLVYAEPDGPLITRNASCQVFTVDSGRSSFVWTQDLLPDELASVVSRNMDIALPDMLRSGSPPGRGSCLSSAPASP